MSIVLNIILLKKNKMLNTKKYPLYLTILLPSFIIFGSIIVNNKIYDWSYDGNTYHKLAIGMLTDGWNPLYEKIEEFDITRDNPINPSYYNTVWDNHYAKGVYIFDANIAKITGNIETGKSINIISICLVFLLIFSALLHYNKNILFSLLFSLCVISCPTICVQFLTNYIDLLVYLYFFLTISLFFMFEKSELFENNIEFLLIYLMTLIISINIKASLFGYVGLFCLGYFIWYLYRLIKKDIDKKFFIKFIITSAISVIIGVFVVGLSVYPKNYLEKGNPFYPLFGENKIDIMTHNQPVSFNEKSPIKKYIISTYSKFDNILASTNRETEYKIPFVVYSTELDYLYNYDTRISGNGIFFSGILTLSIITCLILLIKCFKEDKKTFILLSVPLLLTTLLIFFFSEAWWARYFPQSYLFIFIALLLLNKYTNKNNLLKIGLIFLLIFNNYLMFSSSVSYIIFNYNREIKSDLKKLKKEINKNNCNVQVYSSVFEGYYFDIERYLKGYNISFLSDEEYKSNNSGFKPIYKGRILYRCCKELNGENK